MVRHANFVVEGHSKCCRYHCIEYRHRLYPVLMAACDAGGVPPLGVTCLPVPLAGTRAASATTHVLVVCLFLSGAGGRWGAFAAAPNPAVLPGLAGAASSLGAAAARRRWAPPKTHKSAATTCIGATHLCAFSVPWRVKALRLMLVLAAAERA